LPLGDGGTSGERDAYSESVGEGERSGEEWRNCASDLVLTQRPREMLPDGCALSADCARSRAWACERAGELAFDDVNMSRNESEPGRVRVRFKKPVLEDRAEFGEDASPALVGFLLGPSRHSMV